MYRYKEYDYTLNCVLHKILCKKNQNKMKEIPKCALTTIMQICMYVCISVNTILFKNN